MWILFSGLKNNMIVWEPKKDLLRIMHNSEGEMLLLTYLMRINQLCQRHFHLEGIMTKDLQFKASKVKTA